MCTVLTGRSWRYSSTHRVGVMQTDTFKYIDDLCRNTLSFAKAKASSSPSSSLCDAALIRRVGETLLELEFQWIKMFWIQGMAVCIASQLCIHLCE